MDTSKIIKGVVSNGRYTVTAPIVKEDYGLYLKIEGVELPPTYQVDFSNSENSGTSVTMIGNADGVLIPHQFISTGKDVFAFLYHVGEDFGRTVYKFRIPNKVRPDRTNEEPTPEEQSVIDQTISALNEAVAQTAQDKTDADASAQSAQGYAEQAESARDTAQTYANNAQTSATQASTSASQASASATASANSASASAQIKADVEELVDDAQGYAESASQSATASANSATTAQGYAQSASASAQSASGYASNAQSSAQTASGKASEASQSASQASGYAQTAETAKTDAQTAKTQAETARDNAVTAKTAAETAQGKAETAQGAAEDAAQSVSASAAQIATNTAGITDLKEGLSDIENVLEMSESAYTSVDSVEEMTDHTKSYVLRSNNHIYTAQEVQGDPPNEFAVRLLNKRIYGTSPFVETMNGFLTTEYIPFTQDDFSATIRLKNGAYLRDRYGLYNYGSCKIVGYDANKANIINSQAYLGGRSSGYSYLAMTKDGNDLVGSFAESDGARNAFINAGADNLEYVAFCFPIATESKDDVTDAELSAITQAEVDAKDLGIYISTHGVVTYQFVDTGTVYVQQSAIQRIDAELAEKLDTNQGSENVGKVLMIGADGTVEPTDIPEPTTDDYKITLTVGAWGANGKTPTSDGNQLRNTEPIPLAEVRKIKINLPTTLSKCTGHAYIFDSEQNLIGVTPWGAYIDLNSVASNAVYANISISAFDLNGTAITAIAPYLEDVQSNIVVYSPNSAEAMDSFRNKSHGTVMFNEYIMPEVNATILALQDVQFAHQNALTLAFMTDLHYGRDAFDTNVNLLDNLACVQMVSSECIVGGLMMGGDNIAESSTRANQILNLKEYGRKVRQFGDRVFSTKGNHDDSSISGWDSFASKTKVGYNLFDPEYYLWTERQIENLPNVVFPDDPTGLYYYVDFPAQKVRLIVLNSVDIPYVEDPNNQGYLVYRGQSDYGYSNAQLNWVAHTALDFSDKKDADEWGVVTMQHINDNPNISAFSTAVVRNNGAQMYNIFKAFKARSTYLSTSADTYFPHDVSVDFTNATQELIARISGHTHADRYVLSDDGLHISTMQAGPNSVGNSPASDGVTYTKTAGTGKESAVDFFTFDRIGKKVYCTRYGAGLSRELSWV